MENEEKWWREKETAFEERNDEEEGDREGDGVVENESEREGESGRALEGAPSTSFVIPNGLMMRLVVTGRG